MEEQLATVVLRLTASLSQNHRETNVRWPAEAGVDRRNRDCSPCGPMPSDDKAAAMSAEVPVKKRNCVRAMHTLWHRTLTA
jgi:hypothetical protein